MGAGFENVAAVYTFMVAYWLDHCRVLTKTSFAALGDLDPDFVSLQEYVSV